jgi:hypothetical protein
LSGVFTAPSLCVTSHSDLMFFSLTTPHHACQFLCLPCSLISILGQEEKVVQQWVVQQY